jgi:hypothetical protein
MASAGAASGDIDGSGSGTGGPAAPSVLRLDRRRPMTSQFPSSRTPAAATMPIAILSGSWPIDRTEICRPGPPMAVVTAPAWGDVEGLGTRPDSVGADVGRGRGFGVAGAVVAWTTGFVVGFGVGFGVAVGRRVGVGVGAGVVPGFGLCDGLGASADVSPLASTRELASADALKPTVRSSITASDGSRIFGRVGIGLTNRTMPPSTPLVGYPSVATHQYRDSG